MISAVIVMVSDFFDFSYSQEGLLQFCAEFIHYRFIYVKGDLGFEERSCAFPYLSRSSLSFG